MITVKIGARIFKTALAIFLALIIPHLLGIGEGANLAATSVVFSMLASIKETVEYVLNRMIANVIGGIIAVSMAMALGNSFLVIAFAAAILIAILHTLNLNNAIALAVVTLISVMMASTDTLVTAAISRVAATIIGVLITIGVNAFVLPPKYDLKFYHTALTATDDLTRYLRSTLRKNSQYDMIRQDMNEVKNLVNRMKLFYSYMKDPSITNLIKHRHYSTLRMLVVSRQVVKATEALYGLTKKLIMSEDTFGHLPDELRILIRERLETLMVAHDQILLKWSGRVMPDEVNFLDYKADLRKAFMEALYREAISDEALKQVDYIKSNDLISLMAKIFEYDSELAHLNMLMRQYVKTSPKHDMMETNHYED